MTPLLIAAHQNDIDTVRVLVNEYQADITARDRHGFTAVAWAEKSANLEVLKYLRVQRKIREKAGVKGRMKRNPSKDSVATAYDEKRDSEISLQEALRMEELALV